VRSRLPLLLSTLLGVGLLAAVPGPSPAGAAVEPPVAREYAAPPIDWERCPAGELPKVARCGDLVVPLDHADPDGPTITLRVSRITHTTEQRRGVMFTNPGGPGGSGLWMAQIGGSVPGKVGESFDWYGMDPRGVGASRPALTCDPGYNAWDRPAYVPTTSKVEKAWRTRAAGYARSCGTAKAKRLLAHVRTTDTVADLEVLRRAIGAETVGFYGASYGTYLAQVYATLHPDRLDRVVMDGVIDARRVFYRSNLDQDRAFEAALRRFFAWIGRHDDDFGIGRSQSAVRRTYERLLRRLDRRPAAGGRVGPAELTDALTSAGYTVNAWPMLAHVLSDLARTGDGRGVAALYGGPGDDNGYAMYLATECTDAPWPRSWRRWERDADRIHEKAPFLTWSNAWYNAPCRRWPVPAGPRVDVSSAGVDVPVLLLSETLDAATPYAGALATRELFPTSALVAGKGGTTHAAGLSGVACVDRAIARYLRSGALPKRRSGDGPDLTCPAVPVPPAETARAASPEEAARVVARVGR
jgi:pimeloyl-ACP methyl ester carboxylesterase